MRAKFYTVSQHENGGRLSLYLEQSLSQIAVAFGHSFLIRNVAMEEAAQHLGEDETAISILAESASFAPLAQQAGAFALERAFFHNFRSSLLKRDGSPQGTIDARWMAATKMKLLCARISSESARMIISTSRRRPL